MASFTQEQLDALEGALAEGALEVHYRDRKVIYRSLTEMLKIRDLMRKELGVSDGSKRTLAEFSKGIE